MKKNKTSNLLCNSTFITLIYLHDRHFYIFPIFFSNEMLIIKEDKLWKGQKAVSNALPWCKFVVAARVAAAVQFKRLTKEMEKKKDQNEKFDRYVFSFFFCHSKVHTRIGIQQRNSFMPAPSETVTECVSVTVSRRHSRFLIYYFRLQRFPECS